MQHNGFSLSRRALLSTAGYGAGALPFLPLLQGRARAASPFPKRLVLFLGPLNGLQPGWVPATTGPNYALTDRMAPLQPFRSDLILLSGMLGPALDGFKDADKLGMGGLFTGSRALLSGATGGWPQSLSVDQEIAKKVGGETPFRSVQLGVQCDLDGNNILSNMVYSGKDSPIPPVNDPYAVFDRLFGSAAPASGGAAGSTPSPVAGDRLRAEKKSVLDESILAVGRLKTRVGAQDKAKLGSHLEALRSIEKRLAGQASPSAPVAAAPMPSPSATCPPKITRQAIDLRANDNFPAIYRLQCDALVAALQCDRTRIATFQPLNSISKAIFKWVGVTTDFHFGTMHGSSEADRVKINGWFIEQFAYLLKAMKAVPEGDGTLLDHTTLVWCGEFGLGNHDNAPIPFIIAGGRKNAGWKSGQHLSFAGERYTRVLQTLLHSYGVNIPKFGDNDDGKGPLPGLI